MRKVNHIITNSPKPDCLFCVIRIEYAVFRQPLTAFVISSFINKRASALITFVTNSNYITFLDFSFLHSFPFYQKPRW